MKKEKGALLLVSWLFILLLSPFVSPEAPGEQTPRKEKHGFPRHRLLPGSPLAFIELRVLGPKWTKRLPKPRTQNGRPMAALELMC